MSVIGRDIYEIVIRDEAATSGLQTLDATLRDLRKDVTQVGAGIERVERQLDGVARAADQVSANTGRLRTGLLEIDAAANLVQRTLGAVRQGVDLLAKPVNLAVNFENDFNRLRALSTEVTAETESQLKALAARVPQTSADIMQAAFQAISAGFPVARLQELLETASKAAVAGGSTLTEAVDSLRIGAAAFVAEGKSVSQIADIMVTTANGAVTDFRDLGKEFGGVAFQAAALGLESEETLAALGGMTEGTANTGEAVTLLAALLKGLTKPTGDYAKFVKQTGVDTSVAALRTRGLVAVLTDLKTSLQATGTETATLFDDKEASRGLATLIDRLDKVKDLQDKNANSAGAVNKQFGVMTEGTQKLIDEFKGLVESNLTELGTQLLPTLNEVLRNVGTYLKENGDELRAKIVGIVEGAVSLGEFVTDHSDSILTFLGVFTGVKMLGGLAGVASGIGGIATAAGVARVAILAIPGLGQVIGAVLALATAVAYLNEVWRETTSIPIGESIESFARGVDLDVRLAQATVQRAQDRQQIASGNGLLLDPNALNAETGEFSQALAGKVATLQEALGQGLDVANDLVQRNVQAFQTAAEEQRRVQESALAGLEGALVEQQIADAEVQRLMLEQANGNILVGQELAIAMNRRAAAEQQIASLEGQALTAKEKAAELELGRAKLLENFQRNVGGQLFKELKGLGTGLVDRLNADALRRQAEAAAKKPRSPKSQRDRAKGTPLDELFLGVDIGDAYKSGIAAAADFLAAQEVNARRRVELTADASEREVALLEFRFERERVLARAAGEDVTLLTALQARERGELLRQQEQDRFAQSQELEGIRLRAIQDEGARELADLQLRQAAELFAAQGQQEKLLALRQAHELEMSALIEAQNQARVESYITAAQDISGIFDGLAAVMEAFGLKSNVLTGLAIVAEGIYLQAKAVTYGIRAGAAFLDLDPRGFGFAALALQAQAGAIKQFKMAAELGASKRGGGGGPSGSGARGGGGGANRGEGPRFEAGGRAEPTVIHLGDTHFHGDVFDTREGAERAFAHRTARAFQAVEGNERGIPHFDARRFQR